MLLCSLHEFGQTFITPFVLQAVVICTCHVTMIKSNLNLNTKVKQQCDDVDHIFPVECDLTQPLNFNHSYLEIIGWFKKQYLIADIFAGLNFYGTCFLALQKKFLVLFSQTLFIAS